MRECICIKAHFKVPDWEIRIKKVISKQRVYFRKGEIHTITEEKGINDKVTIDGLFKYIVLGYPNSQFNKYFADDVKTIRKFKLRKLAKCVEE